MSNNMPGLARTLMWIAWAAAASVLVGALIWIAQPDGRSSWGIVSVLVESSAPANAPMGLRALAVIPPALAFAFAMSQLAALLKLIARGEVFSRVAGTYLRRFGMWLLISTVAEIALETGAQLIVGVLHGDRQVALDFSSRDLWNVFLSALFMLVARVLSEAYHLAEENRQII